MNALDSSKQFAILRDLEIKFISEDNENHIINGHLDNLYVIIDLWNNRNIVGKEFDANRDTRSQKRLNQRSGYKWRVKANSYKQLFTPVDWSICGTPSLNCKHVEYEVESGGQIVDPSD